MIDDERSALRENKSKRKQNLVVKMTIEEKKIYLSQKAEKNEN